MSTLQRYTLNFYVLNQVTLGKLKLKEWDRKKLYEELVHLIISSLMITCPLLYFFLIYLNVYTRTLMLIYTIYILLDKSANYGGYPSKWVREHELWNYYSSYWNSKLIKTYDLDPNKAYIFGYHPHGLIGLGALTNFGSNGTGFNQLFNNMKISVMTLPINFYVPFYREFFLFMGLISCDQKSIAYTLNKLNTSVVVIVGGAKEAIISNPGKADLILKDRVGFIKVALKNGVDLVPVYSFGENYLYKIYDTRNNVRLRPFLNFLKQKFGFYIPSVRGRTPFSDKFGHMPRRVTCTTVVGRPIPVEKDSDPSIEKIRHYHELYKQGLKELYDQYKHLYNPEKGLPIPELNFC